MFVHSQLRGFLRFSMLFFVAWVIAFSLLTACEGPEQTSTGTDRTNKADHPGTFFTMEKQYPDSQVDGYNMYVPNSCTSGSEACPLIVFLQGGLGVGGKVEAIFNWELPKELKEARDPDSALGQLKLNTFVYVMPHISSGEFYNNVEAIQAILDEVIETYNIDEQRVYLTGLSRGGHGTWGLASKIPERFAAIAPIAGAAYGVYDYEPLARLPIWVAHNTNDRAVDIYRSQNAIRKIENLSGEKFYRTQTVADADYMNHDRIFTSGENKTHDHDAWTEMYNEVNFYKWLLRFRKE